jgi:hypothetical protein
MIASRPPPDARPAIMVHAGGLDAADDIAAIVKKRRH